MKPYNMWINGKKTTVNIPDKLYKEIKEYEAKYLEEK